jgi:hypothetical protein
MKRRALSVTFLTLPSPTLKLRFSWGCSSAGRALAWHARGQGFDPPQLHQNFVPGWRNWQTRRIQNPVRFTPRAGSTPAPGTKKDHTAF